MTYRLITSYYDVIIIYSMKKKITIYDLIKYTPLDIFDNSNIIVIEIINNINYTI